MEAERLERCYQGSELGQVSLDSTSYSRMKQKPTQITKYEETLFQAKQ